MGLKLHSMDARRGPAKIVRQCTCTLYFLMWLLAACLLWALVR